MTALIRPSGSCARSSRCGPGGATGLARAWNQAGIGPEVPRSTPQILALAGHRPPLKPAPLWRQASVRRGPGLDRGVDRGL
jgi:hypothetical protein